MYRIFSTPRYAVRIGLYFRAIDVGMFQIHMVLLENIGIRIQENLFDGVRKFISDEDAKEYDFKKFLLITSWTAKNR